MLYYQFTQQFLRQNLRSRWTSNKDIFGNKLNDSGDKEKTMHWARSSQLLMKELDPVEGETFLFCRTPPAVGKAMKAAALVGLASARNLPGVALAVVAGTMIFDKVPSLRRFKRSPIWFKYFENQEEWKWSPYRDQEYQGDDFWISIHQREVTGGHFAGCVLEGTSAHIASILANNSFNLSTQECELCFESKISSIFASCGKCSQSICNDCFSKVDICPFCRASY